MINAFITLLTNEAAASSSVLCCPTITVSANPVIIFPSWPIMIGNPKSNNDLMWYIYSVRLIDLISSFIYFKWYITNSPFY